MTATLDTIFRFLDAEHPAIHGRTEYVCRLAIRDLVRLHGFPEARNLVAGYLIAEAERRPITIEHERT